jgi:hypothetical protein
MKKARAILFLCLFSGIVSAQTLWGGFMIDIKNAAGDTVSTTNLQAVKTFVGAGGGGSVATDAIWDAKGDLAVGTGANTAVKLTVGTDGKQIYADADEATGLRWGPYTISPSQITSDQDDYAPTGWDEAQIVRLDADNSIPAITSFAATFDGDRKRLTNIGSYPFYIPGEHPDGTAANRVTGLPKDAVVMPGKGVVIEYDGTASRWRVYDYADDNAMNNGRSYCYNFLPGSTTAADWGYVAMTVNAGSFAATAPTSTNPMHLTLRTATNSTGTAVVGFPKTVTTMAYFGSVHMYAEGFVSIPTLSDGSQTFEVNIGFFPTSVTVSLNSANNVGIRYTHGTNSGKFQAYTRDNSSAESTADTGVTVTAGRVYVLRVELNKDLSEARYYIDGVMVARITGNMPTAGATAARAAIVKSVGTTERQFYLHRLTAGAIWP